MEGCLDSQWLERQQQWLTTNRRETCPRRWLTQLIRKLLLVSWDMWQFRNSVVHHNEEAKHLLITSGINQRIRKLHKVGRKNPFLPPIDKEVFKVAEDTLLAQSEYKKKTWILQAQRIMEKDQRRLQANSEASTLRRWILSANAGTQTYTNNH